MPEIFILDSLQSLLETSDADFITVIQIKRLLSLTKSFVSPPGTKQVQPIDPLPKATETPASDFNEMRYGLKDGGS